MNQARRGVRAGSADSLAAVSSCVGEVGALDGLGAKRAGSTLPLAAEV